MGKVTYYLDEDVEFPDKDMKVLDSKFKGKVHIIEMGESDVKDGSVKSQKVVHEKLNKAVILNLGLSKTGKDLLADKGKFVGKFDEADDYEFYINVNNKRHKATIELLFPTVKEDVKPEYTFANTKLKGLADGKTFKKIESVALAGPSEIGHGPVEYLGGALHTHVTNTEGIAWIWKSGKMHIVAIGKKNNQNKFQQRGSKGKKLKTCEYDWSE